MQEFLVENEGPRRILVWAPGPREAVQAWYVDNACFLPELVQVTSGIGETWDLLVAPSEDFDKPDVFELSPFLEGA